MLAAMLLLASASIAEAQGQQPTEEPARQPKPARVVSTFWVSDGQVQKAKRGLAVRIEDFSADAAVKASGGTLSEVKRLEQRTLRYLWDWRRDSKGEQRRAVLNLGGGDKVPLKVRRPRVKGGDLFFRARRASPIALPQEFGTANLRVTDRWYPIVARVSANGGVENYACNDTNWRTGPFSCHGRGEGQNTDPWQAPSRWNSNDGGRVFQMSTYQQLDDVWCPICPQLARQIRRTIELNGTSGGWGTRQVAINDNSFYRSVSTNWGRSCTTRPVSGTDDSLVAKPGGPLRTDLKYVGGILQYDWYILTVTGYLSEPFPPPEEC
jgi:hypothetical protein